MADENILYYGDNLDVLRQHVRDESVDLIYLDPPFNSQRDYNVLFKEQDGTQSPAQIRAFEDTWKWDELAATAFRELIESGDDLGKAMACFRALLGQSDILAYLSMMAPRLMELRRVLKETGSVYLHCDPAASHYLKMLMDSIFGAENLINEVVWKRTASKGLSTKRLAQNHDVLLAYRKSSEGLWQASEATLPYDLNDLDPKTASKYSLTDEDGRRYQLTSLINPNRDRPNLTYEFLGVTRVWRWTRERMEDAYQAGKVVQTRPGAVPRYKRYLDEQKGKPLGDVWTDLPPLNSRAAERLGYPTQKPEALLERILRLSTRPGDTVLDPFCGCGTTVSVAQRLARRWVGIDITHLATHVIKNRLSKWHGLTAGVDYQVRGEPTVLSGARILAQTDTHGFEHWALGLVQARASAKRKGADGGIDGWLDFYKRPSSWEQDRVIISVKSGKNVGVAMVRDLGFVVAREEAAIGVLILMTEPTKPMRAEAAQAGSYESGGWGQKYRRIQILTVEELLNGAKVHCPPVSVKAVQTDNNSRPVEPLREPVGQSEERVVAEPALPDPVEPLPEKDPVPA